MDEQVLNTVMIPVEEYAELRATADLLARVQAEVGAIRQVRNNTNLRTRDAWPSFQDRLEILGPADLLRELAEALSSRSCSSQSE